MSKETEYTEVTENTDGEPESTETEPTMFDAVSEAIDAETVDPEGADDGAPTGETDVEGEPKPDAEGEPKADAEGEPKADAEGEPKADAEGEPKADAEGEPKADAEGEPKADAAATPDFVNDPIPDGLKEGTRNRIQGLIEKVKENDSAADDRDEMVNHITSSGATGEQFGATLGWLTLYNSSRIEDRREALKIMQDATAGLASEIGEPVPGADILATHADLQTEVEEGTLTQKRAEEIAAGRSRKAAADTTAEAERTATTQTAASDAAVARGQQALNELEVAIAKVDSRWAEKKAILLPSIQAVMRSVHPDQWATTFKASYEKLILPPKAETPKPKPKEQEPLRPKVPAGQGTKTPTTMFEAIDQSLGQFDDES